MLFHYFCYSPVMAILDFIPLVIGRGDKELLDTHQNNVDWLGKECFIYIAAL